MYIAPTLNRAMYFAIRAYHRLSDKPIPSMRLFYTPITSNVVYDETYLKQIGLKQTTLKRHKIVPFRGVHAFDCPVSECRTNVALPCRYVHNTFPESFLAANAHASELVHIKQSADGKTNCLVALCDLPKGTDLGVLAGVEWLHAQQKSDTGGDCFAHELLRCPRDPYVWQCYVGDSDDGCHRVFLQISTKHYGNFLRHVKAVRSGANSRFVATHPGLGAVPSAHSHFSRLPSEQYRRYWRLIIKKATPKGSVISVPLFSVFTK